jgi:hypothetical protein
MIRRFIALSLLLTTPSMAEPQVLSDRMRCEWIVACLQAGTCRDHRPASHYMLERIGSTWWLDPEGPLLRHEVLPFETVAEARNHARAGAPIGTLYSVPMGHTARGELVLNAYNVTVFPELDIMEPPLRHHCIAVEEPTS